jgi:flagella basal body P-ring formation protein FlgA
MRSFVITSVCALAFVAAKPHGPEICWIDLKASVAVKGIRVTLGDVAAVDSLDESSKQRLSGLELGRFTRPSDTLVLTRETLVRLLSEAGYSGTGVTVRGAERVEVRPERETIDAARLEALARKHIATAFTGQPGILSVAVASEIAALDVIAPRYRTEVTVEADPKNRAYAGLVNLVAVVTVDGETVARHAVPMYVRREAEIVVAKRRVPVGRKLEAEDLGLERREITRLGADVIESVDFAIGLLAIDGFAPQQAVLGRGLKQTPIMRKGAVVTARLRMGGISAETLVRASEDGAQGDRIMVVNADSKRNFYARVIDSQTVEVEP